MEIELVIKKLQYWKQKSNTGPRHSEADKTMQEGRQGAALYGGKKSSALWLGRADEQV